MFCSPPSFPSPELIKVANSGVTRGGHVGYRTPGAAEFAGRRDRQGGANRRKIRVLPQAPSGIVTALVANTKTFFARHPSPNY